MKENTNILDEINKGASMGVYAVNCIIKNIKNDKLKDLLYKQYNDYKNIMDDINKIYKKFDSNGTPHKISTMSKIMTCTSINMKTCNDKSTSKYAELLIEGTNMGIVEGRKILNHKHMNSEIKNIVTKYVTMQEKLVDQLKNYL